MITMTVKELLQTMQGRDPDQVLAIEYLSETVVAMSYPNLPRADVLECMKKGKNIADVDYYAELKSKALAKN